MGENDVPTTDDLEQALSARVLTMWVDDKGVISWDGEESFESSELARMSWVLNKLADFQWDLENEEGDYDEA